MEEKKLQQPVQVKFGEVTVVIPPEIAQGVYANLVLLNHSPDDFVIDFAFVDPVSRTAQVRARIILSPSHLKRFFYALKSNLERYEATFGQIPTPTPPTGPKEGGVN